MRTRLLGLMSGTSLDGIDAALLEVEEKGGAGAGPSNEAVPLPAVTGWELMAFHTRSYTPGERVAIEEAIASGRARELNHLHILLGEIFASAAQGLLEDTGISPSQVAAVGSHGQTVWHSPPSEGERGGSLQLGCPATLAERTGIGVVSDFRSRDLAAGGHGAPLVPWADGIFFSSTEGPRTLQNLGGMGNVTWLPRAGDPTPILAFDTGPGVALLDAAAAMATGGEWSFDRDGQLARKGELSPILLEKLLAHPFFRSEPPRSTGREIFGTAMVREAAEILGGEQGRDLAVESREEGWPDLLATLVAFTARSLGDAYRRWVIPRGVDEVYLMGGGARNPALFEAIQQELSPIPVRIGTELGMDPDAREAATFALLAWAHIRGVPANVPHATGSAGPRVLGSWTPGRGKDTP